jgi:hypothetical protein
VKRQVKHVCDAAARSTTPVTIARDVPFLQASPVLAYSSNSIAVQQDCLDRRGFNLVRSEIVSDRDSRANLYLPKQHCLKYLDI